MLIGAGAAAVAGSVAPPAVLADVSDGNSKVKLLRWDLIQIANGVVLAGGIDFGLDIVLVPAGQPDGTGDTVQLTGSGQAEPAKGEAAGGGTWLLGTPEAEGVEGGVYTVTGFNSFTNAGGTLAGVGLTDGIGEIEETTAGILSLNVHLFSGRGGGMGPPPLPTPVDGVLTVNCALPGASFPIEEGITLSVGSLKFVQPSRFGGGTTGFTLFHVLRGKE